jgi:SAM-dependent methyltransferase
METASSPPPEGQANEGIRLDFKRIARSDTYEVTLPDGVQVRVERSRDRVVPGLGALGPSTEAMIDLAIDLLGKDALEGVVLDLGSGCGLGTRKLSARAKAVVAIEANEAAARITNALVPQATTIGGTVEHATLETLGDAAILVDVLAFAADPRLMLRGARRLLRTGGKLVVVEIGAYPSQALLAPARRAMSPSRLHGLLECAGFRVDRCGPVGGVVVAEAVAMASEEADLLESAALLAQSGDADGALALLDQAGAAKALAVQVQATLDAVDVLVGQGRADDACARLLSLLRRHADEARCLATLSQFMVAAGETGEAKMLAERAHRQAPLDPGVVAALAIAQQATRDAAATATWKHAHNLSPDVVEIALPAAAHALEVGHAALAERMLNRTMSYEGNMRADTLLLRARVRLALGRREDAKLDARLALAADPRHEEAKALVHALENPGAA